MRSNSLSVDDFYRVLTQIADLVIANADANADADADADADGPVFFTPGLKDEMRQEDRDNDEELQHFLASDLK